MFVADELQLKGLGRGPVTSWWDRRQSGQRPGHGLSPCVCSRLGVRGCVVALRVILGTAGRVPLTVSDLVSQTPCRRGLRAGALDEVSGDSRRGQDREPGASEGGSQASGTCPPGAPVNRSAQPCWSVDSKPGRPGCSQPGCAQEAAPGRAAGRLGALAERLRCGAPRRRAWSPIWVPGSHAS